MCIQGIKIPLRKPARVCGKLPPIYADGDDKFAIFLSDGHRKCSDFIVDLSAFLETVRCEYSKNGENFILPTALKPLLLLAFSKSPVSPLVSSQMSSRTMDNIK